MGHNGLPTTGRAWLQELLGRGTGAARGHLGRERAKGLVPLEKVLASEAEQRAMVLQAEALSDLVRVKIEDDNDLGLALSGGAATTTKHSHGSTSHRRSLHART